MKERANPGGGLTGATGDLTPDDTDQAFVPGELREQAGADAQGSVTYHQGVTAPAQQGEIGDPGAARADEDVMHYTERESGYGSEHGLSPNDPAYRMEVHAPAGHDAEPHHRRQGGDLERGIDEVTDHEEHF